MLVTPAGPGLGQECGWGVRAGQGHAAGRVYLCLPYPFLLAWLRRDGKVVGILYLTGMTMAQYDITGLRAIFDTLQNHYPERCGFASDRGGSQSSRDALSGH